MSSFYSVLQTALLFFLSKKVGKKDQACEVGLLNVLELRPERF